MSQEPRGKGREYSDVRCKMSEGRRKSFMKEEGRSKMEDVTFRPTHRLSSCTLSPISSPTLHSQRKLIYTVYRSNNCFGEADLSNRGTP